MKIKIVIVDDESPARSYLRKLLNLLFSDRIVVVGECESVQEAVKAIHKFRPDIVF